MFSLLRSTANSNPHHHSQASKTGRLLLFAYCFLSFLPLLSYLVVRPSIGFFYMLFVLGIHSTNGVLLFVMSSMVRKRMPFRRLFIVVMDMEETRKSRSRVINVDHVTRTIAPVGHNTMTAIGNGSPVVGHVRSNSYPM